MRQYNTPAFIANDPICIQHQYTRKQDIEIAAFFAAILAWGQRKTIINKCNELFARMDNAPYDFMVNHEEEDLRVLLGFKHRTFNDTDLLYFVSFFRNHYRQSDSLERAFLPSGNLDIQGSFAYGGGSGNEFGIVNTAVVSLDTTINQPITLHGLFSAASASNAFTLTEAEFSYAA